MKVLAEHHASPKTGFFGESGVSLIDRAIHAYRSSQPPASSRYDRGSSRASPSTSSWTARSTWSCGGRA